MSSLATIVPGVFGQHIWIVNGDGEQLHQAWQEILTLIALVAILMFSSLSTEVASWHSAIFTCAPERLGQNTMVEVLGRAVVQRQAETAPPSWLQEWESSWEGWRLQQ